MEIKKCSKCGEIKEEAEFRKCSANKDGLKNYCRQCDDAYNKERYKENKTEIISANQKWAAQNKDKVAGYVKKFWAKKKNQSL